MKLDYKILRNECMGISGSSLLKVIQNNDMPILDLLNREVIQNSLDAKLEDVESVNVDINIGNFNKLDLNEILGSIGQAIGDKYNENLNTYISYKDYNTTGLTGPISMNDVKNNQYGKFLNLIFNIGKAQELNGSGGSWGYGKTVYYRVGIGVVIFYTRILEDGEYKSRLVISFVEDEKDTIIPSWNNKGIKTGVVWFGKKVNDDEIMPITNEQDIEKILKIFNIEKYKEQETGTTIIIPYINDEKILKDASNSQDKPYWCEDIESYIKASIQRWYAPRLMNYKYKDNPYLKLNINGKLFNPDTDFLPLFKIVQELYNACIEENMQLDYEIQKEKISLNSTFSIDSTAGILAFTKINKNKLKMLPPDNEPDPYIQINNKGIEGTGENLPIITFCRKPGMLLKYDIKEKWSNSIANTEKDEYLIGLFIANSKNNIIKKGSQETIELEEYLRQTEKADHSNWNDINNYNIVARIQTNIQSKINARFFKKDFQDIKGLDTKFNRELTRMFLPAAGFGSRPSGFQKVKTMSLEKNFLRNVGKTSLKFIDESLTRDNTNNTINKDFMINLNKKDLEISYEFAIVSERENISANIWEETLETKEFPIDLISIDLLYKKLDEDINYFTKARINKYNNNYIDRDLEIEKIYSKKYKKWIGWKIKFNEQTKVKELKCRLKYRYINSNYICTIKRGE